MRNRLWSWKPRPRIAFDEALRRSAHLHARLHGKRVSEWGHEIIEVSGRAVLDRSAWCIGALVYSPDVGELNPGVYAISARKRMLYVGHTSTCLRERLERHHMIRLSEHSISHPGELMLAESDVVRFYCCGDERIAQELERAMIEWFEPVYNAQWW